MRAQSAIRALGAGTLFTGSVLAIDPHAVAARVTGSGVVPPVGVVRLLGARLMAQGLVLLASPRRGVVIACCGVDVTHAASMIGCAVAAPRNRRAALASATLAGGSAAVSGVLANKLPA